MNRPLLASAVTFACVTQAAAQAPGNGGTQTRADVAARVQEQFTRADSDHDGSVTQAEALALSKLPAGPGAGQSGWGRGQGFFTRFDTNADGAVTRVEFDAARAARAQQGEGQNGRGEGMFARFDSNRDGSVSRAEFDAVRQQMPPRMGQGGGGGLTTLTPENFATADTDKNGRVTLQEAQTAALGRFDVADTNRDGQLTREERQQLREGSPN